MVSACVVGTHVVSWIQQGSHLLQTCPNLLWEQESIFALIVSSSPLTAFLASFFKEDFFKEAFAALAFFLALVPPETDASSSIFLALLQPPLSCLFLHHK